MVTSRSIIPDVTVSPMMVANSKASFVVIEAKIKYPGTRDTETADASKDLQRKLLETTQLLDSQSIWYQQAFARLFGDSFRTFKFQLSQHMNNLETLLNAETLHEMDSQICSKCDQNPRDAVIENSEITLIKTAQTFKGINHPEHEIHDAMYNESSKS
ncbi:hypothetical protein Tco_0162701 [Tanacetum coccineum]